MLSNILFFLLILICCSFEEPKYCKLSDRIFFAYNKELKKTNDLQLVGSGGAMMEDIKKVNASYVYCDQLSIADARRLYVMVIEGYLLRYNQDKLIRPYLHEYPFTIKNIDVKISFKNERRQYVDKEFVAFMFIGRNFELVYDAYDTIAGKFVTLYKEPYETARDIVLSESK